MSRSRVRCAPDVLHLLDLGVRVPVLAPCRERRTLTALEHHRSNAAREAKVISERQVESERLQEAKLDSRFNQKLRYEEAALEPNFNFGNTTVGTTHVI